MDKNYRHPSGSEMKAQRAVKTRQRLHSHNRHAVNKPWIQFQPIPEYILRPARKGHQRNMKAQRRGLSAANHTEHIFAGIITVNTCIYIKLFNRIPKLTQVRHSTSRWATRSSSTKKIINNPL